MSKRQSVKQLAPAEMPCYAGLAPWAAELCEQHFEQSREAGRRRRAARVDFAAGWMEAARQLGRLDVFVPETTERAIVPVP